MPRIRDKSRPAPHIIGVGMIVLDIIISNGAKKPIFRAGGTCGNVLAGLSFLGWKSIAISRAGSDLAGDILTNDLKENGVITKYITREDSFNTPKIIEKLRSNGECAEHSFLMRCPHCGAFLPRFRSPKLDDVERIHSIEPVPDVYFFDKVTPSTLKLARLYKEAGSLIIFEPNSMDKVDPIKKGLSICHVLKYASNNKLNGTKKTLVENQRLSLINDFNPLLVICTLGEQGLSYRFMGDRDWRFSKSIRQPQLHDTCGAGDWLTIGLIVQLDKIAQKRGGGYNRNN